MGVIVRIGHHTVCKVTKVRYNPVKYIHVRQPLRSESKFIDVRYKTIVRRSYRTVCFTKVHNVIIFV